MVGLPIRTGARSSARSSSSRRRRPGPGVDDLRAHCEGRLAGFKHPRRVEVVDALPRTSATGQVQRTLLVERITARVE